MDGLDGWVALVECRIVRGARPGLEAEAVRTDGPVLVEYWSASNASSKAVLDKIAETYKGKLTIARLNVEDSPMTPGRYGVRGNPTFVIIKNGSEAARRQGALSESQLKAFIDSNI